MKVVHLVHIYNTVCGRDVRNCNLMLTRDVKEVTCKQCLSFMSLVRREAK